MAIGFDYSSFACPFASAWGYDTIDDAGDAFCAFEFPACRGCPKAMNEAKAAGGFDDPMKSKAWRDLAGLPLGP
jgi:hypothetical protein